MFSTTYKVTTSEFKKCVLNVVLCSKNRLYAMKEISRHVVRVTGHIIAAGIFSNYNYTVGYISTCNGHKSWNFLPSNFNNPFLELNNSLSRMASDPSLVCCFLLLQSISTAESL